MTWGLSDILSVVALMVSAVSIGLSWRWRRQAIQAQYANVEIQMRTLINNAHNRYLDIEIASHNLRVDADWGKHAKALCDEVYLNSVATVCAAFLDKKIDVERFRRSFRRELMNIMKDTELEEYVKDPDMGYRAISEAYNQVLPPA